MREKVITAVLLTEVTISLLCLAMLANQATVSEVGQQVAFAAWAVAVVGEVSAA